MRIYRRDGAHATAWSAFRRFGPLSSGRFDPHLPPAGERHDGPAVYYAATAGTTDPITTALAEAFQTRVIDPLTGRPWLVAWTPRRSLRLLDLAGPWTTRAGGNQALCSGDRGVAQAWARAIHAQFPTIDGVTWNSSVIGTGRVVALFERAEDAVPHLPDLHLPLDAPALRPTLARAATTLAYALV
ncbi:MAG TPA: RES family NAD+ phosphorylase [Ilumatobacter sp.]|nr:RES family NAD+ phosphorylase [Ilumatobacter sp.]